MNQAGIPCGPINQVDQAFADPQVRHVGIAQSVRSKELGDITLLGQPFTLSRTPSRLAAAAPEYGEHTDEVLREAGFSEAEISAFRAAKAI
jgi:formyl-CoA transferase